jgi:hypothetical protein
MIESAWPRRRADSFYRSCVIQAWWTQCGGKPQDSTPAPREARIFGIALRNSSIPPGGSTMSHQPPKQQKKKAQMTPKEKKAIKHQKPPAGQVVPLVKGK